MRLKRGHLAFSAALFVFVLVVILTSFSYEPRARLVPLLAGLGTLALTAAVLVNELRPVPFIEKLSFDLTKNYRPQEPAFRAAKTVTAARFYAFLGWLFGFFLSIFLFGFSISIALFTLAFLKVEGRRTWLEALLTAAIVSVLVFITIEFAMGLSLFKGWLFGEIVPPL
ncbi:MAG: hypothetical protein FJY81_06550 [Candidatus Aminicenantes bacterium]|nr:hypothetical protein [Candidatus Aminicenantes bacterium]